MLSKNILLQLRGLTIKFTYILMIIVLLSVMFLSMLETEVKATNAQYTEKYSSSSFKSTTYPGYESLIESLKKQHPNWTFTILYTGLDWNQVLKNETTAKHGRNLISSSKTGEWICSTCGSKSYDNGSWRCASESAVAYYMDPRNSLFEDYIFQFENLEWIDGVYSVSGVKKIIADCDYLQGSTIKYTTTNKETKTIKKSYAQVIYDAAKKAGISPYHLASRIRQEQGTGNASSTATGKYSGYEGYYNYLNINASGSSSSAIIKKALEYAKTKEWTDPQKSIEGGAEFLAKEYIKAGQNTLYLQKFDVDNSDGSLYWHQYQQNVSAAMSESSTVLKTYKSIDSSLSWSFNFVIPVYNNMPDTRCSQPASQSIVTQNIQITDSSVVVRKSKSTSADKLTTLKKGDKILRIEIGNTKSNGYYWDKVVLDNGKKGYVISNTGFKVIDAITNCSVKDVATEPANLRNGPGTSNTTVITTLTVGQSVTIVEKNKYKDIDGYDWSRVYLSDGRQGYLVSKYVEEVSSNGGSSGSTDSGKEILKVTTSVGLNVREHPGTDQKVLVTLSKGDLITRIDKSVSNDNGYTWDKIVTDGGIEGYVARGDNDGDYYTVVSSNTTTTIKGTGIKTSGTNVICTPDITVSSIKKIVSDAVIKNTSGKEVTSGNIGTGYTIKVDGMTYTVVKKGDVDGDGKVKATDYMRIKNYIMGSSKLTEVQKQAADVNKDGIVKATDYMKIKNYIMGSSSISI